MKQLKDLAPNPTNPRRITDEKLGFLKKSLERFGDISGFVYNVRSGRLVGAHQRQKVMPPESEIVIERQFAPPNEKGTVAYGYVMFQGERFSYRAVSWDDDTEHAANLAANKGAGEWDFKLLGDYLLHLDHQNFDMDLTMFSGSEIEDIMAPRGNAGLTDPDDVPAVPKVAKSKRGELWLLGNHRVLCGDATILADVQRLMDGNRAALWSSDPPYGINHVAVSQEKKQSGSYSDIQNDDLQFDELKAFLEKVIRNCISDGLSDGFAFYMWHAMKMQSYAAAAAAAAAAGILFHRQIIWVKPSLVFGRGQYHWRHELCLMGWLQGKECPFYGERNQTTVWELGRENDKIHPTQKPIAVTEIPIGNHTKSGESVLDPFLGSGSTLIACEKTGRKCFGLEIEPVYVDVILDRWAAHSGKDPVREDGVRWSEMG